MKTIRLPMNFILPDDADELKEAFIDYPQISVKSTGEYLSGPFYDDPIYELTSDEIYLRDWILAEYDSEMSEDELEALFSS